jgi:hypothetical protein
MVHIPHIFPYFLACQLQSFMKELKSCGMKGEMYGDVQCLCLLPVLQVQRVQLRLPDQEGPGKEGSMPALQIGGIMP